MLVLVQGEFGNWTTLKMEILFSAELVRFAIRSASLSFLGSAVSCVDAANVSAMAKQPRQKMKLAFAPMFHLLVPDSE